ncbi:unnamed protein product [Arctia plantaginis]|uniref:Uncharacterized protein n=1 Tax=Arctia plantaginis TaxID=874455 RepID=A0A8S1AHV7_ARCPL|nr:unnamed protein product [Arctia plantaginis]CAB3253650.1 unnamed protein product [Arctia plantaginis]
MTVVVFGRRCGRGRCAVVRRDSGSLSMRVRAHAPAPLAFDFPRPGDGGGALHNCVAALRARYRSERPPRARYTRRYAQRRALYVTRDHRARSRDPSPPARGLHTECWAVCVAG